MKENFSESIIFRAMWSNDMESRIQLYRDYGIEIGKRCFIDYGVWLEPGIPSNVKISDNVVISHDAKILGHDSALNNIYNFPIVSKTTILEKGCYIGTSAIILPGVTVGAYSIIGAGSVVTKNVPRGVVACGNPATVIGTTEALLQKHIVNKTMCSEEYLTTDSLFFDTEMPLLKSEDISDNIIIESDEETVELSQSSEWEMSIQISNETEYKLSSSGENPVRISYHILDEQKNMILFEGERTLLAYPLLPFNKREIKLRLIGLDIKGTYIYRITLVQESNAWFDTFGIYKDINVVIK